MHRQNAANLPVADQSVDNFVGVTAELFAFAERQLVREVAADDVRVVVVARSPITVWLVDVLPSRLAAGALCLSAAPTGAEVSRRVAEALGVGVGKLAIEAMEAAFFQDGLEPVVALVGVGHVSSRQGAESTQAVSGSVSIVERTWSSRSSRIQHR